MSLSFFELPVFQTMLLPNGILGWAVWVSLIITAAWLIRRFPGTKPNWTREEWLWLFGFVVSIPIFILAVSSRFPVEGELPIPISGSPSLGALLPFLAAIPWVLATVRLGNLYGVLLAGLSGFLLGFWCTGTLFSTAEFAFIAAAFGAMLHQGWRTRVFALLRQPLVAAISVSLIYPALFLATSPFWAGDDLIASLDFGFSRMLWTAVAFAIPMLIAATALQILGMKYAQFKLESIAVEVPPSERSLEARFLLTLGPIVLLAFLALGILGWWAAGRAADQLYSERVSASVELAADSVPFLLETGQNLMLQLTGDTGLADASAAEALSLLQNHMRAVPYFEQLLLLDTGGNTIVSFPITETFSQQSDEREIEAVSLALQGLALQYFTVPSVEDTDTAAQLSFVAPVRNSNNQVRGVLIGRTSLASNPFAQPIVQSLNGINALGGQGLLIDGDGLIAMSPQPEALLQSYEGRRAEISISYEEAGTDGGRRQVHYEPVTGSNWAVVVQWPARLTQQLALSISLPILGVLIALAIAAYLALRYSLRSLNSSLQALVVDAKRIASGELHVPLTAKSEDEVGRLSSAFEAMRQTLQARMEEVQRLLRVSQGVSSTLDIRSQIDPILNAALASGAASARLVFHGDNGRRPISFGQGEQKKLHRDLDPQILALSAKQDRVLLTNPARARLKVEKGSILPTSIAAFALRQQGEHLGALWMTFGQPQSFSSEQTRYFETLAEQAAKAATNARLYVDASGAKRRFEGLLNADTDIILITNEAGKIVFTNAAAAKLFANRNGNVLGVSLEDMLNKPELFEMVISGKGDGTTEAMIAGRTYEANYSVIQDDGKVIGRALILRDITQGKQSEAARTESLSMLSHDLQDPLELSKGYLNMLSMVGDLNEQQAGYIAKIEQNIESISQLSMDMLNLERLASTRGLHIEKVELTSLVSEAVAELEPRAKQKKVTVLLTGTKNDSVLIESDAALLKRAFYNLLDNAIKVSPRGAKVDVVIDGAKDPLVVSITDHGPGIAPVDHPKIFASGTSGQIAGLAIVKSVIERHRGRVWVESELGTGSTFHCELPLRQP